MRPRVLMAAVLGLLAGMPAAVSAEGRVELELATEEGFPALEAQRWYRLFTDLNVDGLTIRSARATDKPEVVTAGKGENAVYRVTGILTSRNELLVPGGKFSVRDSSKIAAWLKFEPTTLIIEADGKEMANVTISPKDAVRHKELTLNVRDVQKLKIIVKVKGFDTMTSLSLGDARVIK